MSDLVKPFVSCRADSVVMDVEPVNPDAQRATNVILAFAVGLSLVLFLAAMWALSSDDGDNCRDGRHGGHHYGEGHHGGFDLYPMPLPPVVAPPVDVYPMPMPMPMPVDPYGYGMDAPTGDPYLMPAPSYQVDPWGNYQELPPEGTVNGYVPVIPDFLDMQSPNYTGMGTFPDTTGPAVDPNTQFIPQVQPESCVIASMDAAGNIVDVVETAC